MVVMNRHSEILVVDDSGRERERYRLVYGSVLAFDEGTRVEKGTILAEWDPYALPILTEVGGIVRYDGIIEGVTMSEQLDEVTGLSRKVTVESRDPELRPAIVIMDPEDPDEPVRVGPQNQPATYYLPVNANINVNEGDHIVAGHVVARVPRETTKTKDITGGLPRVAELFEARKPKEHAMIAEIDGFVTVGRESKGKVRLTITPDVGEAKEYLMPKGKHLAVRDNDRVKAGELLMDGAANPHDILRVLGEKELARYLVNEIQEVYRLQGVTINDKHIEVIVRQMLRRVRIRDVGDTNFLVEENVEKYLFEQENQRVIGQGKRPAVAEPLLLGITKASLATESFISASSFQETTKVLTEAAVSGRVDDLRGLKENVIMGRLIPAGTGLGAYKPLEVICDDGPPPDFSGPESPDDLAVGA
jgi:DNA-directed RNA polymerase subunit beta'